MHWSISLLAFSPISYTLLSVAEMGIYPGCKVTQENEHSSGPCASRTCNEAFMVLACSTGPQKSKQKHLTNKNCLVWWEAMTVILALNKSVYLVRFRKRLLFASTLTFGLLGQFFWVKVLCLNYLSILMLSLHGFCHSLQHLTLWRLSGQKPSPTCPKPSSGQAYKVWKGPWKYTGLGEGRSGCMQAQRDRLSKLKKTEAAIMTWTALKLTLTLGPGDYNKFMTEIVEESQ